MKIEATITTREKVTLTLPDYFTLESPYNKSSFKVIEGSVISIRKGIIVWDTELSKYQIENIEQGVVTEISEDEFYSKLNELIDQLK